MVGIFLQDIPDLRLNDGPNVKFSLEGWRPVIVFGWPNVAQLEVSLTLTIFES